MSGFDARKELVRFWLEARHGCLVGEGIPVPVPYALSDLDLVALHPELKPLKLPGGAAIGPRLGVAAEDEHDWEPTGREFGAHPEPTSPRGATPGSSPAAPRG